MNAETKSHFERLAAINVNEHVEKKNGLSYLSWAWAVDQLLRADPEASWEYLEPIRYGDTMQVVCRVSAFGKARVERLPVMDHRNKPIANPDAFQVNTAEKRCLVKAIALHGLGLYIYAGEDLPPGEEAEPPKDAPPPMLTQPTPANIEGKTLFEALAPEEKDYYSSHARALEKLDQVDGYDYLTRENFSDEEKLMLSWILPAKVRNALKTEGTIRRAMSKSNGKALASQP